MKKQVLPIIFIALGMTITGHSNAQENANLVINGTFDSDWSNGWHKNIVDGTDENNVQIENTTLSGNNMLKIKVNGKGATFVNQMITLPKHNGVRGLILSLDVKIKSKFGHPFGLKKGLQSFIGISLNDKDSNSLGLIRVANDKKNPFCGSGMADTCQIPDDSGTRCTIPVGNDFQSIKMPLDTQILDCLPAVNIGDIREVEITPAIKVNGSYDSSEILLDNVKLYYQ